MKKDEILKRMHEQKLYFCDDQDLFREQLSCLDKVFAYNQLKPSEIDKKTALLKEMCASFGIDNYIETPFHANWGCKNVYFGSHIYANFNFTLVDDCKIYIDDYVMIGPNVTISAGTHPVDPALRRKKAQYNIPIHIEENVWIGAQCVILPGVRIGKNSIIGAGSIVTKDIPANVIAVGSPCKVLRAITEKDKHYYNKDLSIDIQ